MRNYWIKSFAIFAIFAFALSGCLTTEYKEFTINLKKDGSGSMTIKYINIMSQKDNDKDVSQKDFGELITDYYQGDKVLNDYPDARLIKTDLFEENNALCGIAVIEFDKLEDIKIYKYDDNSPYMINISSYDFIESNGTHGGDYMPIIFFDKKTTELKYKTKQTTLDDESKKNHISLLDHYKKWKN